MHAFWNINLDAGFHFVSLLTLETAKKTPKSCDHNFEYLNVLQTILLERLKFGVKQTLWCKEEIWIIHIKSQSKIQHDKFATYSIEPTLFILISWDKNMVHIRSDMKIEMS